MSPTKKVEFTATLQEMAEWAKLTGADSITNTVRALMTLADEAPPLGPQPTTQRTTYSGFCELDVLTRVYAKVADSRLTLGDYLRETARRAGPREQTADVVTEIRDRMLKTATVALDGFREDWEPSRSQDTVRIAELEAEVSRLGRELRTAGVIDASWGPEDSTEAPSTDPRTTDADDLKRSQERIGALEEHIKRMEART